MTNLTPEQLKEKYNNLPDDLKEAIFSANSAETIQEIGKKYSLSIEKMGQLADETGLVMLGITHPRDFVPNLSKRLGVDSGTARKIAEDVNEQIFKKVRESLKKLHGITEDKPAAPTTAQGGVGVPTPEGVEKETPAKEEIMREIEKEPHEEKVPEILKGMNVPEKGTSVFDEKTKKEEPHGLPPKESEHPSTSSGQVPSPEPKPESQYPTGDPYREAIE